MDDLIKTKKPAYNQQLLDHQRLRTIKQKLETKLVNDDKYAEVLIDTILNVQKDTQQLYHRSAILEDELEDQKYLLQKGECMF
ncbi:hypothetical protein SS50377_27240 [Spironucleus salmonicida]|uniref:Uncharacterized protein n=1 Tax=Spironucleus salmonicida TaxID=348837 RepID=V6LKR9_9EUKA|nr:hypothetical protein SS50377_27240 [Spironucleus salmonicida]|eukprot:EST44331.1 Hypothetical protein SS50377_15870 [Spironucleus salmonicida]